MRPVAGLDREEADRWQRSDSDSGLPAVILPTVLEHDDVSAVKWRHGHQASGTGRGTYPCRRAGRDVAV